MAAVEAIRCLGCWRLVLYEVTVAIGQPDRMVDITAVMQDKQRAMACFSEVSGCSYDAETVGAVDRLRAERFLPQAVYAEAQHVLDESYLVKSYLDRYASEHRNPHRVGLGLAPDDVPLVSVLMRSMDRDTLAEALDSITLQTYPNAEVIVANARGAGTVHFRSDVVAFRSGFWIASSRCTDPWLLTAFSWLLAVNGDEQVLMDRFIRHLRQILDVDRDEPRRIVLEDLDRFGVAFGLWDRGAEVGDAVAPQTAIQARARNGGMDKLTDHRQQVVQRQQ
jgi:hypothetical protein